MFKKIISILACASIITGIFTGCSREVKLKDVEIANFTKPVKGEKIAVITVKDYGTIKIKLFPDYAPKGVENFEGLIDKQYYDELIFHRIYKGYVAQTGDPKGNGTGGNSMWDKPFANEISDHLWQFTGAVAYANSGKDDTNGSQFYILGTQKDSVTDKTFKDLSAQNVNFPQNVKDKYKEIGGEPAFDKRYTVFGQVFEGMDVVYKIVKAEVDANDKPVNQIMVQNVKIVEYEG